MGQKRAHEVTISRAMKILGNVKRIFDYVTKISPLFSETNHSLSRHIDYFRVDDETQKPDGSCLR